VLTNFSQRDNLSEDASWIVLQFRVSSLSLVIFVRCFILVLSEPLTLINYSFTYKCTCVIIVTLSHVTSRDAYLDNCYFMPINDQALIVWYRSKVPEKK